MPQVKKILSTNKDFKYSHGVCNLNFTLKTDTDEELKSFRKCLIEAMKDIDTELKQWQ